MKNFARVMGLLFGSAGAHTYPKSGQVVPPPRMADVPRIRISNPNVVSFGDIVEHSS